MDIAIVGIGCRFPGASTPGEFWRLLRDGVDAVTEIPPERFDVDALFDPDPSKPGKLFTRWGGLVDGIDRFDAGFFGISPREAQRIDPQHRLLLEVVWEALEDAGLPADRLAGSRTGVFVGVATSDYARMQLDSNNQGNVDTYALLGTAGSVAANRISFHFDLLGPSMAVDTACSSSLVATHLGCRSLATGESDVVIVGGVNAVLTPEPIIGFCKAGMLSPDGRCRAFDARANGYVRSEGAGVVVLKPLPAALADGDPIHAVIRGTATNQDGHTVGITVPSARAQQELILAALADAGLGAADVQYVEAHGTGTAVGDPLEASAIGGAFAPSRPDGEPLLIGSVKTNIGHLEAAAGIVGLIKTALALEHREIPPHLHLREPNPRIPFDELRLRMPTALEAWPETSGPARAGVNSFGFGGANAHVVLEEPPPRAERAADTRPAARILTLSARSDAALRELAGGYRELLHAGDASLADICHTAALRRTHHPHRLAVAATSPEQAVERLDECAATGTAQRDEPKLAFVFTGMGPLWWGMGRQLMREEPVYRETIQECDRLLRQLAPWSLLDELAAGEADSRVAEPDRAQVINLAVHLALTTVWRSWGIVPDAVVGHSAGELGAACVAGAIDLPDALRIAYHRGRLQQRAAGTGTMLAAGISEAAADDLLAEHPGELSLAAVNSPTSVTLSGAEDVLRRIDAELRRRDVFRRFLPVTVPYHGPQLDQIRDELLDVLATVSPRPARIPIVSVVTGDWTDGADLDARYWWRNVRLPVRFADAVGHLVEAGYELFVEVGPHPVLTPSLRECLAAMRRAGAVLPTLRRQDDERMVMLTSLAQLYVRGREIDWPGVFGDSGSHVPLPTYPWQRERYWIEPPAAAEAPQPPGDPSGHPLLGRRLRSAHRTWQTELSGDRLAYLEGHVLGDTIVFPGAGYVEMALAAAREITDTSAVMLRNLRFHTLLPLAPRDDVVLQTSHEPRESALEIHSARAGERAAWTRHATVHVGQPPREARRMDIGAIRRRCATELAVGDHYRALSERRYRYRGAFTGIRQLWRGNGEALGRIELPSGLDADGYLVHPCLLDSAFQLLLAALDTDDPALLVPTSIGRVELHHALGTRFWAYAEAGDDGGRSVCLIDDTGSVALGCYGLRLRPVRGRALGEGGIDDCRYQMRWRQRPREADPAISTRDVLRRVRPVADRRARDERWADYYRDFDPRLDVMTAHFARAALAELGWSGKGRVPDVVPEHRRYLARLVEIVEQTGTFTAGAEAARAERAAARAMADDLAATHPGYRAAIQLVRHIGEQLADVLRARVDAREELFAADAVATVREFYHGSGPLGHANAVLAEVMAAVHDQHRGAPLRVLEVGAGTGGATAAVLPRLPAGSVEYTFTDISPFFLATARDRFADRPDLRFEVLDIEAGTTADGGYDVVLAADVLHATADVRATLRAVRRLLRPGGLLVLLEVTRKVAWGDLVFGALEGWWRFTDTDLRPDYPLLAVPQWQEVLADAGFTGVRSVSDVFGGDAPLQAVLLATAAETPRRHWVVLGDGRGVADAVAAGFGARGQECTLLPAVPADVVGWTRLLRDLAPVTDPPPALLHLGSLDAPTPERLTTTELMRHQLALCAGVSALVAAMRDTGTHPELCLVTAGAQPVTSTDGPAAVTQSALWGLGRVLYNEHPDLRGRLVDLSAARTGDEIDGLLDELIGEPGDTGVAFRGRERFTRTLTQLDGDNAEQPVTRQVSPDDTAFHVSVGTPGSFETLLLREEPSRKPGPGEVAIRVHACSVNFRDVLLTLGMLTPPDLDDAAATVGRLGADCAGVVVECGEGVDTFRPGDGVVGVSPEGAFASRVVVDARWVVPKPPQLSYAEAAALPTAFCTAQYALHHAARLAPGERVLIHAATGGVGLATVQLAQHAGAEVFATAGSAEKRAYLSSLGVEHVLDSRSLDFADEILARTGGEGVDVIVNSLAGEAITAGLGILRPYGRFVELGKRDLYADTRIGLLPFRRNLTLCAFDLYQMCTDRPALVARMLTDVVGRVAGDELRLLPIREFDLTETESALRFMAQAKHIGKLVLTVQRAEYPVCPRQDGPLWRADATYVITGGLGGFGLALARRMVDRGARHLVLMSRSGKPSDVDADALRALGESAAEVVIETGDVASEADLAKVLGRVRATMPPLRGIVHAAMVLDDGLLGELDEQRFTRVLAPKIAGAWHLHRLTRADELDFFVLFSSLAAVIGTVMQGNYAAANAFLDGLASYRRALGLPGLAVNWGPIADVGYVSRHQEIQRFLDRAGLRSLRPDEAFDVLERELRQQRTNTVAVRVAEEARRDPDSMAGRYVAALSAPAPDVAEDTGDLVRRLTAAEPGERARLLTAYLVQRAARVLGASPQRLAPDRPLPELGFDSLMAVELQTALKLGVGVQIPVATLLEGASIGDIAALALDQLALAGPIAAAGTGTPAGTAEAGASPGPNGQPTASERRTRADEDDEEYPLSAEQRRFWLLDQLFPGSPLANLHTAVRLTGELDVAALERAFHEVLDRHDILRTRYRAVDGEPAAAAVPVERALLRIADLRYLPASLRDAELHRLAGDEVRAPFDLASGRLMRACLFRLGDTDHVLVATGHHIALDPWCTATLVGEITAVYARLRAGRAAALPLPASQYADYARWQREHLRGEPLAEQAAYWRDQLAGASATVQLPADRPRQESPTHRGGHLPFRLTAEVTEALTELSRREGVTLFMTLLAGYVALLHRYSGSDDISVGTPVTTRGAFPGSDGLIGCCVNTLVMRTDTAGDPPFTALLSRVKNVALAAYDHQDLPFDQVVEALAPQRNGELSPLFNTMLVLHGIPVPDAEMAGLRVAPMPIDSGLALFDLLFLVEAGEQLHGTLEYSTDRFDAATAARILGHYQALLESLVADPEQRLSEIHLLSAGERRLVLDKHNSTETNLGQPCCLHQLVEEQAGCTPDAVAVTFDGASLTYRELDRRANQLAHRLRALGVGAGTAVGVCLERSLELVVAVLGVLKAGGAYLPLDPEYPKARLRHMLDDATVPVVITQPRLADVVASHPAAVVSLDPDWTDIAHESVLRPVARVTGDDIAYVIYTSGSTGEPVGVEVSHRAIVNQVRWRQHRFPLTSADAVLQRTPIGFDPSVWELVGPLSAGARVVVPRPGGERDGGYLVTLLREQRVTALQAVPSLLDVVLDVGGLAECTALRHVFCGGEALPARLRDRFIGQVDARLHNLYGPAEAAIDTTWWTCSPDDDAVPIGRPIANVTAYVVDENLRPVPIGVPGELCIGGAGLARGYLGRPELTRQRFVANPFTGGGRLYRTGDIVRRRSDGALEFVGRADHQLKVRGVRVDPAEIEATLSGHPAVRQAAAVAADHRLVAFVVAEDGQRPDPAELRIYLAERLPAQLVPSTVTLVDALPLTPNDKVDRLLLARQPISPTTAAGDVPPRTMLERQLVSIWERLLDTRPIGIADDFFAIGGHSLLAMRLAARIREELGRELPVADVVRARTVEGLACLLAERSEVDSPLVALQPHGSNRPFFCVHPVRGGIFDYVELAAALGDDRPCYALQSPDGQPYPRIEDMAKHYLAAVRSVQPTGPYVLGGWSMGGVVAYEMARQLTDLGDEVALLVLLDAWPATAAGADAEREEVALLSRFAADLGLAPDLFATANHDFWRLGEDEQVAYVMDEVRRANLMPADADPDEQRHRWQVFTANARAMRAYTPPSYPGHVTVLAAREQPDPVAGDPLRRWERLAEDGVTRHTVPGDHYTMLRAPHVHTLARRLRGLLAEFPG
ncbi:MAG: amino acid adenylation domain-containing protein [Actinophytocola sp.]|nr:amino acid adenylation domain-containing protein [Actinophytocola sp.]